MTKVKTILAEFCSAKDILAINRLGLLKKEERESQPVPWRHRLNNRERRELVRSELRMAIRPPSHHSRKEHVRAINSAKCPKDSKMGECLINGHTKSSSLLAPRLGKICNEQHRSQCRLQQTKKNFLRSSACLNHEPLILVERPATPKVKSRASFMKKHGVDPIVVEMPRYMRPTQARSRTPSTLTTIEAFTVDAKKKKNVWEEAMEDKDDLKFKSTSGSSAKLTDAEVKILRIGHALHKPTEESILHKGKPSDLLDEEEEDESSPPPRCVSGKTRQKTKKNESTKRSESAADGSIFITQLSNKEFGFGADYGKRSRTTNNKLKSVTFSDFGKAKTSQSNNSKDGLLTSQRNGRALMRRSGRQENADEMNFNELNLNNNNNNNDSITKSTHHLKKSSTYPNRSVPLSRNKSKPFLSLLLQT